MHKKFLIMITVVILNLTEASFCVGDRKVYKFVFCTFDAYAHAEFKNLAFAKCLRGCKFKKCETLKKR